MTWYASETDIPTTIFDYDIKKGTTYWYYKGTPVFPFGHGLSYTTFKYENLSIERGQRLDEHVRERQRRRHQHRDARR